MKHNYLRKSLEQRIQRKALLDSFKRQKLSTLKNAGSKETLSSKLRSLSIQNKLKQQHETDSALSRKIANVYGVCQSSEFRPSRRQDDADSRANDFNSGHDVSETRKLFNSTEIDYGQTRNAAWADSLMPEKARLSVSVKKLPQIAANASIDVKESSMSKQDRNELVA